MKKDFSPEERLLRLIKGSGKKDARKENAEIKSALSQNINSADAPSYYRGSGSRAAGADLAVFPFKIRDISTKNVNPSLALILLGLLLYFIADMISGPHTGKEADVISKVAQEPAETKEKPAHSIEPYSYYSSQIEERNIFLPQESEVSPVASGPSLEEISSNLSLIGIIAGDRPQAIIEDKKAGKSYFMYKSGLVGQAKVVDILEDKVVMEYKGQVFELML